MQRFSATQVLADLELFEQYAPFYNGLQQMDPTLTYGYYRNPARGGELVPLMDRDDRFTLVFMPTRSGKGTTYVIPNLLQYQHSAWVNDPKTENCEATAYHRRHGMKHGIAIINPMDTTGTATRWNPLAEIREKSVYEIKDALNGSTATVDPDGSGFDGDNGIWKKRARDIHSAVSLHAKYARKEDWPEATNRAIINYLCAPGEDKDTAARHLDERLRRILNYKHDPSLSYGWPDADGRPTATHPYIASNLQQQLNRPPNEAGSVMSEFLTYLSIYRDHLVGHNTSASDISIADFMHGRIPFDCFFQIHPSNQETLRPYTRLFLNMLINNSMRDIVPGMPPSQFKLWLALDEFTSSLGRLDIMARQLCYVAGFGIKISAIIQSEKQLDETYGVHNNIGSNMHAFLWGYQRDMATAEKFSKFCGAGTRYNVQRSERHSRHGVDTTYAEHPDAINLLDPSDIADLPEDEGVLNIAGLRPIPIVKLPYFDKRNPAYPNVQLWSQSGELADRLPVHLQEGHRDRDRLEREYRTWIKRTTPDAFNARNLIEEHDLAVVQQKKAVDDYLTSLQEQWDAA